MSAPPLLRFPSVVRRDLDYERSGLADEIEQLMVSLVRPCVAITSQRVSKEPLHRSSLTRLFGAREASAQLPVTASKFGGTPYCEGDEDFSRHAFLGQIDLAEATAVLPHDATKLTGLLRIDVPEPWSIDRFRVRWFREPSAERAVSVAAKSGGRWEARLEFRLEWTLPEGKALESVWPLRDTQWFDYDQFFPVGYNGDGHDAFHRMLGHKTAGLDEPYGWTPPAGCSDDVDAYECLLRLTFDRAADFAWGTNWIYLLVPREDLADGDLSRIVVTGANA